MTKIYSMLGAGMLAVCASAFAFNQIQAEPVSKVAYAAEGSVTISPANTETYAELPESFEITFADAESLKAASVIAGNPVRITNPAGATAQGTGKYNGNVMTVNYSKDFDRTIEGEYTVELLANKITLTAADGSTSKNEAASWKFTVGDAADNSGITLTPSTKEEYEALPTTLTFTFEGATSLKSAGILAGNPILITAPDGTTKQQIAGKYADNVMTITVPATFDGEQNGEYTVQLKKNTVSITWPDGTTTKNDEVIYKYTVANGSGDVDNTVKYDLAISDFTPKLNNGLDISMKTLETLQIIINAGDVKPTENATVTITGPGYSAAAGLVFSMGNATNTWLKAKFPDPEYNGEYTLKIAKESMGTPAWFENPETGRTNDEIVYKFNVYNGKDYVEKGVETTMLIVYTPGMGAKVEVLDKVTLKFEEKVYFDEEATVKAGIMTNFQALGYSDFGTATFKRISDTELEVVFENEIAQKGQYSLTIPEGFFWNEEHENNAEAGIINPAQQPYWIYMPVTPTVEVTSTVPANNTKLSGFAAGETFVVNTDNDADVAYMTLTITEFVSDSESDANTPTAGKVLVNNAKTTEKTADGAICWKATEEISFKEGYYYDIEYALFNSEDVELGGGITTIDGGATVGIEEVSINGGENTIYTIQGIRVDSKISELPAGLYIINGKKVMVK